MRRRYNPGNGDNLQELLPLKCLTSWVKLCNPLTCPAEAEAKRKDISLVRYLPEANFKARRVDRLGSLGLMRHSKPLA